MCTTFRKTGIALVVVVYTCNACLGQCTADSLVRSYHPSVDLLSYRFVLCRWHVVIFFNILVSMPEVQLKGVNSIYYDDAKLEDDVVMPGLNFVRSIFEMVSCLPPRFSAMHDCLKKRKGNVLLSYFILETGLKIIPMNSQLRARIHLGSDMEVHYELHGHGISVKHCHIDGNGKLRMDILNS